MSRVKRQLIFHIDEMSVYNFMIVHGIRYLKDFYDQAGLKMSTVYHCQNDGVISLENAWKLAEFMGCMIEDVIQAEYIEEEK